jgi:hypothetical protein
MAGEVQSTQKKFYGGDVAQGESSSACKVKRLKKASVVVDAATDPKTRTVLCDPDVSMVEPPYVQVLSPFKLAEWIDAGYEIYLEDTNIAITSVYQMQLSKAIFDSNGEGRYVSACNFDVVRQSGEDNVLTRWECSTESDADTGSMYVWVKTFSEKQIVSDLSGSCLLTPMSEWQTFDGTDMTLWYIWSSGTPKAATGDKVRLATEDGQTKYRVEVAALGAYRIDITYGVKWDATPVNKTGDFFGFACDFSRHFEYWIGRQSNIIEVPYNQKPYYGFGFQVPASMINAPNGVKFAIQAIVEYLGPVPEAT